VQDDDLKEIDKLAERYLRDEPAAMEVYDSIARVTEVRDPSALPVLRRALGAALQYLPRAEELARTTPEEYKKNAPGGWAIDGFPFYAKEYVTRLRNGIEACTPGGEEVVYEPSSQRKRWWRSGT
jgi:hypothetical protein